MGSTGISSTVLVAVEPFGEELGAQRAGAAIGRGVLAGDPSLAVDLCPIEQVEPGEVARLLGALGFDSRMRAARGVVLATERLDESTLLEGAGGWSASGGRSASGGPPGGARPERSVSAAFELATRARQAGVPAYAVAATSELSPFDARVLDLQVVLRAHDARSLRRAGERLAGLVR
jgi:hypothetical protein